MSTYAQPLLLAGGHGARLHEDANSSPVHRVFYPALDGARTVAFLMVFFHHYLRNRWGWTGVDIFFVLSGFLITGILFQTRDRPHRYRTFYTRRVLRIFPLYYGVFAVLLLLTPLAHFQWNRYWFFWLFHLGNYLRDLAPATFAAATGDVSTGKLDSGFSWLSVYAGHFWSLCVEEQFYLLWPMIVFTVRRRKPLLAGCVAYFVVMAPMPRLLLHAHLPLDMVEGFAAWSLPFRGNGILVGAALALWLLGDAGAKALQSQARVSPFFAGAVAAVSLWLLTHHNFNFPWAGYVVTYPLVDLTAACLIFEALRPSSYVSMLLSWRPLRVAGKFTYGAYVFHDLPHSLYEHVAGILFPSATHATIVNITAALALVCTAVLAWVSYHFYESWFLQWKDRLARE